MTLTVLRSSGQVFCKMSLDLGLPDAYLMISKLLFFSPYNRTSPPVNKELSLLKSLMKSGPRLPGTLNPGSF